MNFIRSDTQTTAGKSLVGVALAHIYDIVRNICLDNEYRVLMTSDIQTFALTNCIELGSVVSADNLTVRIFLITGLLYMLSATAICLGLESDII